MKTRDKAILVALVYLAVSGQFAAGQYIGRVGIDGIGPRERKSSAVLSGMVAGAIPVVGAGRNDSAASHDAAREIPNGPTIDKLLDAMERVESGGRADAVGDGGKSKGYLQLQKAYVADAREIVVKRWGECPDYETIVRSRMWSRRVVLAYWQRYCPKALANLDLRELACTHNAGPRGSKVKATEAYWQKVKKEMERAR